MSRQESFTSSAECRHSYDGFGLGWICRPICRVGALCVLKCYRAVLLRGPGIGARGRNRPRPVGRSGTILDSVAVFGAEAAAPMASDRPVTT